MRVPCLRDAVRQGIPTPCPTDIVQAGVQKPCRNAGFFLFMVTVYVLESLLDQTCYTGMALEVTKRLAEHNSGKNRFTKGHRPWKIIYSEEHSSWSTVICFVKFELPIQKKCTVRIDIVSLFYHH
jgi:predicted GIY-YIG superfamily endonuclease